VLVEDEHSLRLVAKEILEDLGCEVIEAANADEAFERAPGPEAPADLLITDVVMPGLNGRELADRLVQQGRVRRVLFTSGYADDDVLARGVTPAAGGFLQKPYSVASLEGELARLTGRSGSESG
jgi:CheY-like chemotaxis protein